jgi:hypothetical protein
MKLQEALAVARKVLYGEEVDCALKTKAYFKLAALHGVMLDLEKIMGEEVKT